jgi:putative FmdB family regulatory protein
LAGRHVGKPTGARGGESQSSVFQGTEIRNDPCFPFRDAFSREDDMPLYAYSCNACEAEFEMLIRAADTPKCPACGSEKLTQQISRISKEIKYPAIAKSWRRAAAASGDLSNFSKSERK